MPESVVAYAFEFKRLFFTLDDCKNCLEVA
jgi:hypothetical protein